MLFPSHLIWEPTSTPCQRVGPLWPPPSEISERATGPRCRWHCLLQCSEVRAMKMVLRIGLWPGLILGVIPSGLRRVCVAAAGLAILIGMGGVAATPGEQRVQICPKQVVSPETCGGSFHYHAESRTCHQHCLNGMSPHTVTHGSDCGASSAAPQATPTPMPASPDPAKPASVTRSVAANTPAPTNQRPTTTTPTTATGRTATATATTAHRVLLDCGPGTGGDTQPLYGFGKRLQPGQKVPWRTPVGIHVPRVVSRPS